MHYSTLATRLNANCAEAYSNIGNIHKERGELALALDNYKLAVSQLLIKISHYFVQY